MNGSYRQLPVEEIHPENNDRKSFDPEAIEALGQSLLQHGLLSPITVRPRAEGGYWLVAGERRWRAHAAVGLATIKAFVRDLNDDEARDLMLLENLNRVDLNPIEEAGAFQRSIDAGASVEHIAKTAGVPPFRIRWRLRLLSLTAETQALVACGAIGTQYGYLMEGLDVNRQRLAVAALKHSPSAGEFEALCARLLSEQNAMSMFDLDDFLKIDDRIADARAMNVKPTTSDAVKLGAEVMEGLLALLADQELSPELQASVDRLRLIEHARLTGALVRKGPKAKAA